MREDPILIAIRAERKTIEARLVVLNEAERKLTGKPPASSLQIIHPKTPPGEIRAAQLAKLRGAGWITSAELKKRILSARLLPRTNGQIFTSSLRKLVGDGLVEKDENGAHSTYKLRRGV